MTIVSAGYDAKIPLTRQLKQDGFPGNLSDRIFGFVRIAIRRDSHVSCFWFPFLCETRGYLWLCITFAHPVSSMGCMRLEQLIQSGVTVPVAITD